MLITGEAREDMVVGYHHYESKRPGLGARFLAAVNKRLSDLERHPEYYSYISSTSSGLRDVVVPGYPYVIVYEVLSAQVVVYAVHLTERGCERY